MAEKGLPREKNSAVGDGTTRSREGSAVATKVHAQRDAATARQARRPQERPAKSLPEGD